MIRFVDRQSGMFLEGEQAEAYKAKKQAEKDAADKQLSADKNRLAQRAKNIGYHISNIDGYHDDKKTRKVMEKAIKDASNNPANADPKTGSKTFDKVYSDMMKAAEKGYSFDDKEDKQAFVTAQNGLKGILRHERRHLAKESMMLSVNGVSLF